MKTGTLVCGALLASVVAPMEMAQAGGGPGDIFLVTSINGDFSVQSAIHTFLGAPTTYGLSVYPLTVSSALSSDPDFMYEMTWDLAGFGLDYFGTVDNFFVDLDLSSDPNAINGLEVKGSDGASVLAFTDTTGSGMGYNGTAVGLYLSVGDLLAQGGPADHGFTIQWSTVPAPGALALLCLGGLVGARRRRG